MKSKAMLEIMLTLVMASIVITNIATVLASPLEGDITGPGDVPDGTVDILDLRKCAKAFGSAAVDDPNTPWNETQYWDPAADLAPAPGGDGQIDIFDLWKIAKHYGETG